MAWCGDIAYVRTGAGWRYVAPVLDLGSRNLLGYAMPDHMRTDLGVRHYETSSIVLTSNLPFARNVIFTGRQPPRRR